jgi:hypothetical protein
VSVPRLRFVFSHRFFVVFAFNCRFFLFFDFKCRCLAYASTSAIASSSYWASTVV